MKAVILESYVMEEGDLDWSGVKALVPDTTSYVRTDYADIAPRIGDAELVLINKCRIDEAVLAQCPNLKWVGIIATGTDNIDFEACRRHVVAGANVPGYSTYSVAQMTFSLLLAICQCAERNYAGFVYDWEGDPTKDKSPILSRIAYGSIEYFRAKGVETPRFAYINFVDMSRTVRVNVLSPKYMSKGNESLFIRNIIITLMKNLEASWKEKTDFWANNAINYVYSIAYKCFKERELGICTLPHVIALALSDSNLVFHWLSEDPEIALNMSSMLTAWKLGAQQQTAGAVSSAQTPLVLLNNKYIFWVLSPLPEEEFSLDITNKEHPTLLCVGNAPTIKEAVSPAISCIGSVLMSQMNNPGKATSVFMNLRPPCYKASTPSSVPPENTMSPPSLPSRTSTKRSGTMERRVPTS